MNRLINIAVALVLVVLLAGYAATYTVDFNETAIVTTFGNAGEGSVKNAPRPASEGEDAADVAESAAAGAGGGGSGLYFKLPWPIQQVAARYDTRVQLLEASVEQAQTKDQQSVVVRAAVTWRIVDPLAFYRALGGEAEAEQQLRTRVRAANNEIGEFNFNDLANLDGTGTALDQLADRMKERVESGLGDRNYGVEVLGVEIVKLEFPGPVTQSVFQRMQTERELLARRAADEGQAASATLVSEGQESARVIRSFADEQAAELRSRGEQAAAATLAELTGDAAELAVLLDEVETIREAMGQRTRLFVDATKLYPLNRLAGVLGLDDEGQGDEAGQGQQEGSNP